MGRRRTLKLSVHDLLVDPQPSGGINESSEILFTEPELGIVIHKELQQARQKEFPGYIAERPLKFSLMVDDWNVTIHGRVDGLFPDGAIEEFKTTFHPRHLFRYLNSNPEHPYWLQLACYRWLIGNIDSDSPEKLSIESISSDRITLVDARTQETQVIHQEHWTTESLYEWVVKRVKKIITREIDRQKFIKRQKKMAPKIKFPFDEIRPGQKEFMDEIHGACERKGRLLGQAPTGIGKSLGSLVPALQVALKSGRKVAFLTPKNSQFSVAEKAVQQISNTSSGNKVRSLTLGAKPKLCINDRVDCTPDACSFAAGHHDRTVNEKVIEKTLKKNQITIPTLLHMGRKHRVCPYTLALSLAPRCDIIIGDYNHGFSPEANLAGRLAGPDLEAPKPIVLVDEAHNLPDRMREHWSSELSPDDAKNTRWSERLITALRKTEDGYPSDSALGKLAEKIRNHILDKNPEQADIDLFFKINRFREILATARTARHYFIENTSDSFNSDRSWHLHCLDASPAIQEKTANFASCIAFSATLKPLEFYARELSFNNSDDKKIEWPSPFPYKNQKIIIIPQVSTKLRRRAASTAKIAEAILKIIRLRPGHYSAFFPSFAFLEDVADRLEKHHSNANHSSNSEIELLRQRPSQGKTATDIMLAQLDVPQFGKTVLLLAVQGGVFAEGVDLPGDKMIGSFIVGPGIPAITTVREQMRKFYEQKLGRGFAYAYTYPGMAKSIQAAGRVIRTPSDRGIIVLMDHRFSEKDYLDAMPEHWASQIYFANQGESLIDQIKDFWHTDFSKQHSATTASDT